jgi:hypothetical protein
VLGGDLPAAKVTENGIGPFLSDMVDGLFGEGCVRRRFRCTGGVGMKSWRGT